jgi:hypothetical protein
MQHERNGGDNAIAPLGLLARRSQGAATASRTRRYLCVGDRMPWAVAASADRPPSRSGFGRKRAARPDSDRRTRPIRVLNVSANRSAECGRQTDHKPSSAREVRRAGRPSATDRTPKGIRLPTATHRPGSSMTRRPSDTKERAGFPLDGCRGFMHTASWLAPVVRQIPSCSAKRTRNGSGANTSRSSQTTTL